MDTTTWPPPPLDADASAVSEETPQKPLSLGRVVSFCLANLGAGTFYALNNAALPLWLQGYTHNPTLLGLMGSSHSFEGAILQPLVGAASDRMRGRWGRRRPFLLIGAVVSALFLALAPLAAHLPGGVRLGAILGCIILSTLAFNIAVDPYQALLADVTPANQRGRVTGAWQFAGVLGQVVVLLLPLPIPVKFAVSASLLAVTALITCLTTPERAAPTEAPPDAPRPGRRDALRRVTALRQAGLFLLVYFLYGAGVDAVVPNLTLFIERITHCGHGTAQTMFLTLMGATALAMPLCGWLADRVSPQRLLALGFGVIAVASVNGLWVHTIPQVAAVLGLAGFGIAAQNASAFPLLARLVPAKETGLFVGLQTAAVSVAGPLAVVIAGQLIAHGGYRQIFAVCAVAVTLALLALLGVRPDAADREIAAG